MTQQAFCYYFKSNSVWNVINGRGIRRNKDNTFNCNVLIVLCNLYSPFVTPCLAMLLQSNKLFFPYKQSAA